ncbi:MAG: hypothetical protein ACREJU_02210 [Nitrospiraceae bacterium]
MARRTAEELQGAALSLVYIAGNVVDAEKAERLLTELNMDYVLKLEPFTTTSVLGGEYVGLFVYVPTVAHDRCREALETNGLADTIERQGNEHVESIYGA